ncbi:Pcl1 [Kluyveromyces lactis]|nr:Pcl1 [Kluyveromyces lactis]
MFKKKSLEILFDSPVSDDMIKFLTDHALRVIPTQNRNQRYPPSPPGTPSSKNHNGVPSLMTFISRLVRYTNVYTSTLLTTVVYLNRLRELLPSDAAGLPTTCHRIFLACLILSAKYHNDSSPLNKHWTKYTDGMFTLRDVNLMERQLLQLFEWDLRVESAELWDNLYDLADPIRRDLERGAQINKTRQRAKAQAQQKASQFYYHQRNLSACSSTATLLGNSRSGSINSLDILKEYELSSSSSSSTLSSPTYTEEMNYKKYTMDPRYYNTVRPVQHTDPTIYT